MANCISCGVFTGKQGGSTCSRCKAEAIVAAGVAAGAVIEEIVSIEGGGDLLAFIFTTMAGVLGVNIAWDKIREYSLLSAPYNLISAFYYYTIQIPISVALWIFEKINHNQIIGYPNINMILAILSIPIYIGAIYKIISIFSRFIFRRIDEENPLSVFCAIVWLPSLFAGAWFLLSAVFYWLFATA